MIAIFRLPVKTGTLSFVKISAEIKNDTVLGREGLNTILASVQHQALVTLDGTSPCERGAYLYIIRMGVKSIRARRLDRSGGAARQLVRSQ